MPAKLVGKAVTAPPRPTRITPVPLTTLVARADARLVAPSATSTATSATTSTAEPGPGPTRAVTGVTLRAQHVLPGDLFAALPGARVHGADFVDSAVAAGAVAVLTDEAGAAKPVVREAVAKAGISVVVHEDPRDLVGSVAAWIYGEPSLRLSILGVTGTSGKTTTTYMIEAALRAAGHRTGLVGTVETRIAGERLASAFTTPEAPDLQALFAVMVERGVTHVPMEVSSHALALGRVNGTRFAVGGFTNLSQDHLDFHPDMEDYFQAKALLFDGRSTNEVVCVDGEWGKRLVTAHTITVATAGGADWTASGIATSRTGEQTFTMHGPDGLAMPVTLPIPGSFNVANALLAAACAHTVGVAPAELVAGLAAVEVPGRMERVALGQDFTAVVDYAHKPAAVALALDAMRGRTDGRLIVVLGCGGDRDEGKRPLMGEAAARRADLLIVTDDNPRTEDPAAIRAAMREGATHVPAAERGEVVEVGDRRAAIETAVARARAGDVVVIAGKGHETGQEIDGVVHPFSDRDELRAAIWARLDEGGA